MEGAITTSGYGNRLSFLRSTMTRSARSVDWMWLLRPQQRPTRKVGLFSKRWACLFVRTSRGEYRSHGKKILDRQGAPSGEVLTRNYNRCRRCGRSRGYFRKFGLCRICLRELAHEGLIPGVTTVSYTHLTLPTNREV